jgi:hypothetical protein
MGIFNWLKSWFNGGRKERLDAEVKNVIAEGEKLAADLRIVTEGLKAGKPLDIIGQVDDVVVDANAFISSLLRATKSALGIPVANSEGVLQEVWETIKAGEELLVDVLEIIVAIRSGNIMGIISEAREIFVDVMGFIANIRKLIDFIRNSNATTTPITL